jgi:hypothetical protein
MNDVNQRTIAVRADSKSRTPDLLRKTQGGIVRSRWFPAAFWNTKRHLVTDTRTFPGKYEFWNKKSRLHQLRDRPNNTQSTTGQRLATTGLRTTQMQNPKFPERHNILKRPSQKPIQNHIVSHRLQLTPDT